MALMNEFKEFALKGNVVDLAVGVVIGAAFGKIVDSFVTDVLMPPLGLLTGGPDFTDKFIVLSGAHYASLAAAKADGAVTLNYGLFINAIISFLIISFAIFIVIKKMNELLRKPAEMAPAQTKDCPECVSPIPLSARRCKFCSSPVA